MNQDMLAQASYLIACDETRHAIVIDPNRDIDKYLAMVGLIGVGLGAAIRHSAAAIGALVGLFFVLPTLLVGLTGTTVSKFLPTWIFSSSLGVSKEVSGVLTPWAGFAVLCLYVVAALGIGGWLLTRRDA